MNGRITQVIADPIASVSNRTIVVLLSRLFLLQVRQLQV